MADDPFGGNYGNGIGIETVWLVSQCQMIANSKGRDYVLTMRTIRVRFPLPNHERIDCIGWCWWIVPLIIRFTGGLQVHLRRACKLDFRGAKMPLATKEKQTHKNPNDPRYDQADADIEPRNFHLRLR